MSNDIPNPTIFDIGYNEFLTKDDPFYQNTLQVANGPEDPVIANKITGGTISIGKNFYVDEEGNMRAFSATIAGYKLFEAIVDSSSDQGNYSTIDEALAAGVKRLFLRSGTYTLTQDIVITADDVSIVGENEGTVILTGAYKLSIIGKRATLQSFTKEGLAGDWSIRLTSGDDSVIENVTISYVTSGWGIGLVSGKRMKVYGCYIDVDSHALDINDVTGQTVDCEGYENTIIMRGVTGTTGMQWFGANNTFTRNRIDIQSSNAAFTGISCFPDNEVSRNIITNYTNSVGIGISGGGTGSTGYAQVGSTFERNKFSNLSTGITYNCEIPGARFISNEFLLCSTRCLYVRRGTTAISDNHVKILGNHFFNGGVGIYLDRVRDLVIVGNTFRAMATNDIAAFFHNSAERMTDITITGNRGTGTVQLDDGVTYYQRMTITGNRFGAFNIRNRDSVIVGNVMTLTSTDGTGSSIANNV